MIDSHCHLTDKRLINQVDPVLLRSVGAGVDRLVTVGTGLADSAACVNLCKGRPNVRCAVGIHPHNAAQAGEHYTSLLRELQKNPAVVAMGEMGLDYHYDFSPRPQQRQVFDAQLALAHELCRPVIIHCREAVDDTLAMMNNYPGVRSVFHCYTGSADDARRILEAGHLLGFTGIVTFEKSTELRRVASFVPADRMLLETDSPYLSPEPHRKQRVNEPAMLVHVAMMVAQARGVSVEQVDRVTTENVERFFGWA